MITIYGKPNCNYCSLAEEILENKGIAYDYIDASAPSVVQMLHENYSPNIKQVPVVIVEGQYIGGYNELLHYVNTNYVVEGNEVKQVLEG